MSELFPECNPHMFCKPINSSGPLEGTNKNPFKSNLLKKPEGINMPQNVSPKAQ